MINGQEEGDRFPRLAIHTTQEASDQAGDEADNEKQPIAEQIEQAKVAIFEYFADKPKALEGYLYELMLHIRDRTTDGSDRDPGVVDGQAHRCKEVARVIVRAAIAIAARYGGPGPLRVVLRSLAMFL